MSGKSVTPLLLAAALVSVGGPATAQTAPSPTMTARVGINTEVQERQAASRKEPVIAGLLSWLIPGTGSYYAGNSGHGTRHLVLWLGSITAIVVGATQVDDTDGANDTVAAILVLGGLAVGVTNTIWGIITAVNDAGAANRAAGVAGYFDPGLTRLAPSPRAAAGLSPGPRIGLQVLRVAF